MKEVRDVIEMSGKTVFRDGRSHYKKTGIILGIVLAVTFLAGNVLGASSSPDSHIDNLTEEYGSWHVGYYRLFCCTDRHQSGGHEYAPHTSSGWGEDFLFVRGRCGVTAIQA